MAQDFSELDRLNQLINATALPRIEEGIELLPVSHNEFQARWSLSVEAIKKGREMASHDENGAHLVLRAFSLPDASHAEAVSKVWHDYNIEGTDNHGYFTLPGPTEAVNASVGLVNKDGQFSPLVRGESISLPAAAPTAAKAEAATESPPQPEPSEPETDAAPEPPDALDATPPPEAKDSLKGPSPAPPPPASHKVLDEEEICARLAAIDGLPEFFKVPASDALRRNEVFERLDPDAPSASRAGSIPKLKSSETLNEYAILDTVRSKLASEPEPEIAPSEEPGSEQSPEVLEAFHAGASEQLASQWEELWTDKAPLEIRACFAMTGKIAPGLKLLLGGEAVEPKAGGFFSWKRDISTFRQVWPILQAALESPSVPAGPTLEFFKDVAPSQRLLELHSSVEIEGCVTDPDYIDRLPEALQAGANGTFKLSRMLPDGAVVLPSISLIAG
jgi:hypothetical protein